MCVALSWEVQMWAQSHHTKMVKSQELASSPRVLWFSPGPLASSHSVSDWTSAPVDDPVQLCWHWLHWQSSDIRKEKKVNATWFSFSVLNLFHSQLSSCVFFSLFFHFHRDSEMNSLILLLWPVLSSPWHRYLHAVCSWIECCQVSPPVGAQGSDCRLLWFERWPEARGSGPFTGISNEKSKILCPAPHEVELLHSALFGDLQVDKNKLSSIVTDIDTVQIE